MKLSRITHIDPRKFSKVFPMRKFLNKLFQLTGIRIISNETFSRYKELAKSSENKNFSFLLNMPSAYSSQVLSYLPKSKSQIRQDLFVLCMLNFKRNGYFVEIGAANGIDRSNTYMLEFEFDWSGILVEPSKKSFQELTENRTSCKLLNNCVWTGSGEELEFTECDLIELSTLSKYLNQDSQSSKRVSNRTFNVTSISLLDLLKTHDAPQIIDFISIDTEGSEYDILKSFDFELFQFRVIVCEHNYHPNREKIYQLLSSKNYVRVYENISDFDDWYVHSSLNPNDLRFDAGGLP